MIKEFGPYGIIDAMSAAMEGDGAVVRGLVTTDAARAMASFVPSVGRRRAYLHKDLRTNPAFEVAKIARNKGWLRNAVKLELGSSATLWGAYVMRPDMLHAGSTPRHLDGRGVIVSGSLNLDPGTDQETVFFARRTGPVDAPYSELQADDWDKADLSTADVATCVLGVGDMAIVARGTIHGCFAAPDRKAITYRVRGIIPADFR